MNATDAKPLASPGPGAQLMYLRQLFNQPHRVLEEVRDNHGPVVGLGFGPARIAIIGEPGVIADLFLEPTESFRWNHGLNVLGFWVGKGSMLVSDGAEHDRRRGAVQGGFSRRRLNGWIPMILSATDAAINRLAASLTANPETIDMHPFGQELVLEIVLRALCGQRLAHRAQEISDLFQRPQEYLEGSALRQLPHPFPFGRRHLVKQDRRAFDAIIDGEIARLRTSPDGDELNVLESLVTTGELTDPEIRDQILTLIGAGYDTTSAVLSWLFLRAAATPGLWDRLGAEADLVFGEGGDEREADHTTLSALGLADRTVTETLRLHPPGGFGVRQAATDVTAGGYLIPRRTLIFWSPHLAGRDERYWSDPLRFDPDRHVDPTPAQAANAKAAWVPFGGGARNCIGFALAKIELTLIVARLAQRIDLAPIEPAASPPVPTRRSSPQGGAPLRVTPR